MQMECRPHRGKKYALLLQGPTINKDFEVNNSKVTVRFEIISAFSIKNMGFL